MKLVTFAIETPVGRATRLGALIDSDENGRIVDLTGAFASYLARETDEPLPRELAALRTPPDMIGWLRGGHRSFEAAEQATEHVKRLLPTQKRPTGLDGNRLVFDRSEVRMLAPLPRPRSLRDFTTYFEHMSRADPPIPRRPAWYRHPPYYKGNPDSIVGPEDPIPYPYYTQKLDLEIEIAIVIGKEGRNLSFDQAREHIAGYTMFIDSTCRDGAEREPFGPTKRKDFNSVLGPCLVTADEVDETNIDVKMSVDGETWYEGGTHRPRSFLAHHLVAYVSDNETLYPGDVLGMGTIGLGCSVDLHRWIKVGQKITCEATGIGKLTHVIVPGEHIVNHVAGMKGLMEPPATP